MGRNIDRGLDGRVERKRLNDSNKGPKRDKVVRDTKRRLKDNLK